MKGMLFSVLLAVAVTGGIASIGIASFSHGASLVIDAYSHS
jgi:hypothetical protein